MRHGRLNRPPATFGPTPGLIFCSEGSPAAAAGGAPNFAGRREFSTRQAGWTRAADGTPAAPEVRTMLLWIAAAGAVLGVYSLSLAPFARLPIATGRPKLREPDDD